MNTTSSNKYHLFSFKKVFVSAMSFAVIMGMIAGVGIPYKPTFTVNVILWGVIAPGIISTLIYLMYFKKNSSLYKSRIERNESGKLSDKIFSTPVCILTMSGVIILVVWCHLALATHFFAKQPFYQDVRVNNFYCSNSRSYSRGHKYFELRVTDNADIARKDFVVDLPYHLCSFLKIERGQYVVLHGREWMLGRVYEGFYNEPQIINEPINITDLLEELNYYEALVGEKIVSLWSFHPDTDPNLQVHLAIQVAPDGSVWDATILESSGNSMLDQSALDAVYKASPLPVSTDPNVFNEMRSMIFTLIPNAN